MIFYVFYNSVLNKQVGFVSRALIGQVTLSLGKYTNLTTFLTLFFSLLADRVKNNRQVAKC